jgi:hypothetical protein
MRLVGWNANYNNHRRAFEENVALLEPFKADVLVICETAPPQPGDRAFFVGGTPGLAVVARDGIQIEPHPMNDGAPPLFAGFRVAGPLTFDLLATWPVSRKGVPSYHEVLMAALERYADLWAAGRAVMLGDFNSSTRVSSQKRSHPMFVQAAQDRGLVSAYHEQSGESHGEESVPTYLHGNGAEFHLDYGFVTQPLVGAVQCRIADEPRWFEIGDHRPIVLDIDEAALAAR